VSAFVLLAGALAGCAPPTTGTTPVPVGTPGLAVPVNPAFESAVERGTRTRTGRPGSRYWQQWSVYRLEAALDPVAQRLTGSGTVRYFNRSPDTLVRVALHLYQNIHVDTSQATRSRLSVTRGIELARVAAQGRTLTRGTAAGAPGYSVDGTIGWITLPRALAPGDSADLAFEWAFTVPLSAPRMGTDGEVFYLAYWYPQMAVYDDVNGWQTDQYLGNAEFYMGYGDYDVAIAVPAGWVVASTGTLQNPEEVLSAQTRQRLALVPRVDTVVRVVTAADLGPGRATMPGQNGRLTWRFTARNVRDVSWGASARFLWDATAAVSGDRDGDGRVDTAAIHGYYRPIPDDAAWVHVARYGRHAIGFFSRYLAPYPYPQMSVVEGPNCGGMEYPMITCIASDRDTSSLYAVTSHEIGHMWIPMMVGSDEKRYAWQDEGLTQFNESQAERDFWAGNPDTERGSIESYMRVALSGREVPLMRHGDQYPDYTAYAIASYEKPVAILRALRAILGDDVFHRGYQEYVRRWTYKHPTPRDLFATFEDVSGQELGWFWRTWFYETWRLDQAIGGVRAAGDSVEITVENRGRAPMPIRLTVTRADGSVQRLTVPATVWLGGANTHVVRVAASPRVAAVEIDPERAFPDVQRGNQRWSAP
jgi:hypothetical protein